METRKVKTKLSKKRTSRILLNLRVAAIIILTITINLYLTTQFRQQTANGQEITQIPSLKVPMPENAKPLDKEKGSNFNRNIESKIIFSKGNKDELEKAEQISLDILRSRLLNRNTGMNSDFDVKDVKMDSLQMMHTRIQQTVEGFPIWEGEAIVHLNSDGSLFTITDNLKESITVNLVPDLSADEAIEIARKLYRGAAKESDKPKVGIWVYRGENRDHLTYRVEIPRIDGSQETAIPVDFIDAQTGERVFGYDNLQTGTGASLYSGTVTIGTSNFNSNYYMENLTRKVGTFNFNNTISTSTALRFNDTDDIWNAPVQRAGVDAHYGAEATLSYYQTLHNRNGLDGIGGPGFAVAVANNQISLITSIVHYSSNYNNAFWNGMYMTYGDGDGVFSAPLVDF